MFWVLYPENKNNTPQGINKLVLLVKKFELATISY